MKVVIGPIADGMASTSRKPSHAYGHGTPEYTLPTPPNPADQAQSLSETVGGYAGEVSP